MKIKVVYDDFLDTSPELKEHPAMRKMVITDFEFLMFINPNAPQHFSLYVDKQMRRIQGSNHAYKEVEEVNRLLDEAFFFFRFVRDKDILELFLKRHLAKRLLSMSSSQNSIECEKGLIKRIEVYKSILYNQSLIFCNKYSFKHLLRFIFQD
jgi:cullin 3